jgi:hypothetical protein
MRLGADREPDYKKQERKRGQPAFSLTEKIHAIAFQVKKMPPRAMTIPAIRSAIAPAFQR